MVFTTDALNCCVWPAYNVAVAGATSTEIGGESVTVAEALLVESSWLVAVTVTMVCDGIVDGAV